MITGLIIWGIIVVVIGLGAFFGWRSLSDKARFETRKKEIGWGMLSIVMVFASFLFMPLVCLKITNDIGENMISAISEGLNDELISAGAEAIRKETNPKKNKGYLTAALDELIASSGVKDLVNDDLKQNAINSAAELIYGANIEDPLQYSLGVAVDNLMNNSGIAELADKFQPDDIQKIAIKSTTGIADNYLKYAIPNPVMQIFLSPVTRKLGATAADNAAVNTIKKQGGRIGADLLKKAGAKLPEIGIKILFIFSIICASIVAVLLFVIILMTRLPKTSEFEESDRTHIFQYNEEPLNKLNKVRQ